MTRLFSSENVESSLMIFVLFLVMSDDLYPLSILSSYDSGLLTTKPHRDGPAKKSYFALDNLSIEPRAEPWGGRAVSGLSEPGSTSAKWWNRKENHGHVTRFLCYHRITTAAANTCIPALFQQRFQPHCSCSSWPGKWILGLQNTLTTKTKEVIEKAENI